MTSKSNSVLLALVLVLTLIVAGFLSYVFLNKQSGAKPRVLTEIETESMQDARPRILAETGNYKFDDGLRNPDSTTEYALDEFGAGIASREVFNIKGDGRRMRITRIYNATGTAHDYYEYKIELNTGDGYADITPAGFRTTEGADCALQKLRFIFTPEFSVIKISRKWEETWTTPTLATRTIYKLIGNELKEQESKPLKQICNVSDLF